MLSVPVIRAPVMAFLIIPTDCFCKRLLELNMEKGLRHLDQTGLSKLMWIFLNDRLQEGFLQRIRYAMKPYEAYGLIFSWDNVITDSRTLKLKAWKQLAAEEGKELPEDVDVHKFLLYADADHVLDKILLWEEDESKPNRLTLRLSELYYENLVELSEPLDGLSDWLDAVSTERIPCAVVSGLGRRVLVQALERMGLKKYFQAIVSEEDGMESMAHRFLSAALKLDRKPSKCIVFEDEPRGVTAAHNCTMTAVALIGAHPAYHLRQADLAVAKFNELSVINLRRLFAHKGSDFMDMQKQIIEKTPPRRKLRVDTIF